MRHRGDALSRGNVLNLLVVDRMGDLTNSRSLIESNILGPGAMFRVVIVHDLYVARPWNGDEAFL